IVMRKDATFGDCSSLVPAHGQPPQLQVDAVATLAQQQGYSPLLVKGMFYRDLELHEVSPKGSPKPTFVVDKQQLAADQANANPKWEDRRQIKAAGELLVLKASEAHELDVAHFVIDAKSGPEALAKLYEAYNLKESDVQLTRNDTLDAVVDFLRQPVVEF